MNHAGSGDDFIGWIAAKIESPELAAYG